VAVLSVLADALAAGDVAPNAGLGAFVMWFTVRSSSPDTRQRLVTHLLFATAYDALVPQHAVFPTYTFLEPHQRLWPYKGTSTHPRLLNDRDPPLALPDLVHSRLPMSTQSFLGLPPVTA